MAKIGIVLLIWNIIVVFIYGVDKLKAKRGGRRISEATLLTVAFCMGGVGAMFGMVMWNHKTAKPKFRFLVPLFVLCNFLLLWAASNWFAI